jgi:TRAP transporter 4TM/12TM fusion protein
MRCLKGKVAVFVTVWAIATALLHLYAVVSVFNTAELSALHLLCLMPLGFILYPATSKSPKDRPSVLDLALAAISIGCALYLAVNYEYAETRWYMADRLSPIELVLGSINILLIVELTRRAVANIMAVLVSIFILHIAVGNYLPGLLHHPGFPFERIVEMFYLNRDQGIYGMLTGISSTYLILFVLFGAFISFSGVGDYFNNLAFRIAGRSPGGPAKVACWGSCLFGMISGIGTANVYTTGTFTIPMMKKYGFSPEYSAGVEATSGTGGQYMPPIMGAAAFIMAQLISIPYAKVCVYAATSAVLYYVSINFAVHMKARKMGLRAFEIENPISWKDLVVQSYNLASLVVIVVMLFMGYSAMYAGLGALITVILFSYLDRAHTMTLDKILKALEQGVKNTVMVAIACASAGVIVASVSQSAFAVSFVKMVMDLSGGYLFPALVMCALIVMVLGCGMPTTPAYILTASLAVPALLEMKVDIVAAHLFVLYFAKIAELTPPVAICAYAAASIAQANPFESGVQASKLAISGFIMPFAFVYNTTYVLRGELTVTGVVLALLLAILGLLYLNAGIEGWMYRNLKPMERILFIAFGLICFVPNYFYSIPVAVMGAGLILILYFQGRKLRASIADSPEIARSL